MAEERVLSLKLSIQCAKLLGDTSQPHYYPAMFCHVTDVLESFGKMVFDRIKVSIPSPSIPWGRSCSFS